MKTRGGRGFLLLEAMIGGAIVAVVVVLVFSQIAAARREVSYQSRKAVAASIARTKGQELASQTTFAAVPMTALAPVDAAAYPGLQWQWEVVDADTIRTASTPDVTDNLWEIVVRVQVPTATGTDVVEYRTLRKE